MHIKIGLLLFILSIAPVTMVFADTYPTMDSKSSEGFETSIQNVSLSSDQYVWKGYVQLYNSGEKDIGNFLIVIVDQFGKTYEIPDNKIGRGETKKFPIILHKYDDQDLVLNVYIKPPKTSLNPDFLFHSANATFQANQIDVSLDLKDGFRVYSFSSTEIWETEKSLLLKFLNPLCFGSTLNTDDATYDVELSDTKNLLKLNFNESWSAKELSISCPMIQNVPTAEGSTTNDLLAHIIDRDSNCHWDVCNELSVNKDTTTMQLQSYLLTFEDFKDFMTIVGPFLSPIIPISVKKLRSRISYKGKSPSEGNRTAVGNIGVENIG